jgi:hypothetical protein
MEPFIISAVVVPEVITPQVLQQEVLAVVEVLVEAVMEIML